MNVRIATSSTVSIRDPTTQQLEQPRFQTGFSTKRFQRLYETEKRLLNRVFDVSILLEPSSGERQQSPVELRNEFVPGSTAAISNAVQ